MWMLLCEGSRCSLSFPRPRTDVFLARKEGLVDLERAVHVGLRVQQMQEGDPGCHAPSQTIVTLHHAAS